MSDVPWEAATWEGNRRLQHEAFMALSFRDKILELERMEEVRAVFERAREASVNRDDSGGDPTDRRRRS